MVEVARRMGTGIGSEQGNRRFPYDPAFDLNQDGITNVVDLFLVKSQFAEPCP